MLTTDFFLMLRNPHLRSESARRWLVWSTLTGLGWAIVGFGGLPVGRVVVIEGDLAAVRSAVISLGILSTLVGMLIGLLQYFPLRRWSHDLRFWHLATAVGWGGSTVIFLSLNAFGRVGLSAAAYGLLIGLFVGLAQWALLRPHFLRAWQWIPISAVAYALGVLLTTYIERRLLLSFGVDLGLVRWLSFAAAGLRGVLVGAISGTVLLALLRLHPLAAMESKLS